MASASTTANSELPRQSSICSLSTFIADLQNHNSHRNGVHHDGDDDGDDEAGDQASGSLATMDDLLNNIYSESPQPQMEQSRNPEEPQFAASAATVGVDEVWNRIVAGGSDRSAGADGGGDGGAMTLEDFLTKSGAVREEDVRVPVGGGGFGQFQGSPMVVYGGNGSAARAATPARGKRRAVQEPMDKATQQKQRRMIKNRESAARSRERKQAYTIELESLVTQLEEENARLLREEAERKKERYKQLMENLVPVLEKKEKNIMEKFFPESKNQDEKIRENIVPESGKNRTLPVLRRVCSVEW